MPLRVERRKSDYLPEKNEKKHLPVWEPPTFHPNRFQSCQPDCRSDSVTSQLKDEESHCKDAIPMVAADYDDWTHSCRPPSVIYRGLQGPRTHTTHTTRNSNETSNSCGTRTYPTVLCRAILHDTLCLRTTRCALHANRHRAIFTHFDCR